MNRITRSLLAIALTLAVIAPLGAETKTRLNIDDPAFNVKLYEKAVQALKDRDKDPNHKDDPNTPSKNGYKYFEEMHNGVGAMSTCQHQNEIFLTWHRAVLLQYEKALQATYPGETDNLMLPYWNWGVKPSGKYYPAAYEQPDSPLYDKNRDPETPEKPYTNEQLRTMMLKTTTWRGFSGGECSVGTCSDGKPCAVCTPKFGAFESPYHNIMHNWTGGWMTDDKTAAKDPIFWSFHAYIDLVFDCWQKTQKITDVGCPDCPLRALPGNPTAKDMKSTAALGYTYDFRDTACAEPGLNARPKVLAMTSRQKKSTPYVVDFTIPRPSFATAHVRLEGLPVFADYNYSGRVFLYPATVTLASSDADFRKKYQVDRFAVWGLGDTEHAPHHEAAVTADVDASTELDYLAKKEPGAKWKIAVVVDKPSAQYESTRKNASAEVQREITFDHVSVIYDRDYAKEQQ